MVNESARAIRGAPGSNAIWWVHESQHEEYVWFHRNYRDDEPRDDPEREQVRLYQIDRSAWELRHRDEHGNARYVNMVWRNPRGPGWLFWAPGAEPGSYATTWRPTLSMTKRAAVAAHLRVAHERRRESERRWGRARSG